MDIQQQLWEVHHAQENLDTAKCKLNEKLRKVFQRYMNAKAERNHKTDKQLNYKKYWIYEDDWEYDHRDKEIHVNICISSYDQIFDDIYLPVKYFDEDTLVEYEKECRAIMEQNVAEYKDRKNKRELEEFERLKKKLYGDENV